MMKYFFLILLLSVILTGCTNNNPTDDNVAQKIQEELKNAPLDKETIQDLHNDRKLQELCNKFIEKYRLNETCKSQTNTEQDYQYCINMNVFLIANMPNSVPFSLYCEG